MTKKTYTVGDKVIIKGEITELNLECGVHYRIKTFDNKASIYTHWMEGTEIAGVDEPQDTTKQAWELAESIGNMPEFERQKTFACLTLEGVLTTWSYETAKKQYEAWKAKKEIKAGDEVMSNYSDRKIIVTRVSEDEISGIFPDGSAMRGDLVDYSKTGRHFDLTSLMDFLKGESE